MKELEGTDVPRLVGRTIVSAKRKEPVHERHEQGAGVLYLTLDDGSKWTFNAYGADVHRFRARTLF